MNAQSIPSSSQKKQNEFIFTQQQSTPIDLVGNTMEVIPSSINSQTSIVNESMQPQFLKIAILSDNGVVVREIPTNTTVLQLRYYLLQEKIIFSDTLLNGWRLQFNQSILSDDSLISSLSLPQGAYLTKVDYHDIYNIPPPIQVLDSVNAATFLPQKNTMNKTEQYVRLINYSKSPIQEKQPQGCKPSSIPSKPKETLPRNEIQLERDDYFPILHRPGYYMIPSHYDMVSMSKEEVSHVDHFTVGKEGAGEIIWEGETNVCYLNLDDRIVIDRDLNGFPFVEVYPPSLYLKPMPSIGEELNKPVMIRLFNVFPRGLRTVEGIHRFEEMLKRQVSNMNGQWINYDSINGILHFKLSHFSPVFLPHEFDGNIVNLIEFD